MFVWEMSMCVPVLQRQAWLKGNGHEQGQGQHCTAEEQRWKATWDATEAKEIVSWIWTSLLFEFAGGDQFCLTHFILHHVCLTFR